jgi:2-dehydro-3-deoxy-D-arabinonate dehydratase
MKLCHYRGANGVKAVGRIEHGHIYPVNLEGGQYRTLTDILEADNPEEVAEFLTDRTSSILLEDAVLLAPIDEQEVWAAGVTYKRSKSARMEESEIAADCYDRVYVSPRPELFFKATPHRVSGPEEPLRIRKDSNWNVPEPELTLVLNSHMRLVGFTIGNDMSSREIEGDNPLYLPQAKVYDGCCGLGPCITLATRIAKPDHLDIQMLVRRKNSVVFTGATNSSQMARTFDNLIGWLKRSNTFPKGAFLLTGTGIVPDNEFTLEPGDVVEITIEEIGKLVNPIERG